jgi:hypothetical protein
VPAADKENLKRLDLFLGLHGALKQERNVCNHASDSSLRLSVSHIRSMLERYIQMEKDLEKRSSAPWVGKNSLVSLK